MVVILLSKDLPIGERRDTTAALQPRSNGNPQRLLGGVRGQDKGPEPEDQQVLLLVAAERVPDES
jgi:hypothetical protein